MAEEKKLKLQKQPETTEKYTWRSSRRFLTLRTDITRKLRKTKCSDGDARSPKDEGKWSEKQMSYWKRTYEHVKGENGGDRRTEGERQTL